MVQEGHGTMTEGAPPALDLEQAQFDEPAQSQAACAVCKQALDGTYYSVNGHGVCEKCLAQLREGRKGSFFKALLLSAAAGAVGAVVYYAIRSLTEHDLALITIVIGIAVGRAVRIGAGASPSLVYRLMAIGMTWVSMCLTYVPMIMKDIAPGKSGVLLTVFASILSLAVPYFLLADAQILGILIFGFGIWEAWRLSAPPAFAVEGPFQTAAPAPAPQPLAQGAGMPSSS